MHPDSGSSSSRESQHRLGLIVGHHGPQCLRTGVVVVLRGVQVWRGVDVHVLLQRGGHLCAVLDHQVPLLAHRHHLVDVTRRGRRLGLLPLLGLHTSSTRGDELK